MAVEAQGKGGVLAAKASMTHGKGAILAAKTVGSTQGKGAFGLYQRLEQADSFLEIARRQLKTPTVRHESAVHERAAQVMMPNS